MSASNSKMLSIIIKDKTLVKHQELEKKLVGQMRAMQSVQDYIALLQLFYSYFGGLEELIGQHIDSKLLPDFNERRKADLLAADLCQLSAPVPAISIDMPKIT